MVIDRRSIMTVEKVCSKISNNAGIKIFEGDKNLYHEALEIESGGIYVIATVNTKASRLSTFVEKINSS